MKLLLCTSTEGLMDFPSAQPWYSPELKSIFGRVLANQTVVFNQKSWNTVGAHLDALNRSRTTIMTDDGNDLTSDQNLPKFMALAKSASVNEEDFWVVGESSLSREALPYVNFVVVIEINAEAKGGVPGPVFVVREWDVVCREGRQAKNGLLYTIVSRVRRRPPGDKPADFADQPADQDSEG